MTKEKENWVYVQEVNTVWADAKTGEVHYTCIIDNKTVQVTMCLYQAIHLHDIEYLKTILIKYINTK
jgi:hypothetical protein